MLHKTVRGMNGGAAVRVFRKAQAAPHAVLTGATGGHCSTSPLFRLL